MDINGVAGNADQMKQKNRSVVLNVIRIHGPISKAELAEKTKLTFATISNIISELSESNLILTRGYGDSSHGRKPVLYELNANAVYAIGVELGISQIRSVVTNLEACIVAEFSIETRSTNGTDFVIGQILKAIDEVIPSSGIDRAKIAGIGISSPGPVDPVSGYVLAPPNLEGWSDVPLMDLVESRYEKPTFLEKDANSAALGEQWVGTAQGKENVIYLLADEGIGGGIIIHGRIYRGFLNGAGEIGHGTIDVDGPPCNCGNFGCLEAMASGIAVVRRMKEEIRRGAKSCLSEAYAMGEAQLTLENIIRAALEGDKLSADILDEAGRYLGIGVATLINFFNPETIIIGGALVNTYPPLLETIKEVACRRVYTHFANSMSIQRSLLGKDAGVIGAASLVLQYLFDSPEKMLL